MTQPRPSAPLVDRELRSLRESLRELADGQSSAGDLLRPRLRSLLDDARFDPDVARLIEAMGYLTAWHRAAADEDVARLDARSLAGCAPQWLEPVPAAVTVKIEPRPDQSGIETVARGAQFDSEPVDGRRCRFRSTATCDVAPVRLAETRLLSASEDDGPALRLRLVPTPGADPRSYRLERLRLHVAGDDVAAGDVVATLRSGITSVSTTTSTGQAMARTLHGREARPRLVGFGVANDTGRRPSDALLDWPATACEGQRLLAEAAVFPAKFHYLDVPLPAPPPREQMSPHGVLVDLRLDDTAVERLHRLGGVEGRIMLHCVPATNTYAAESEPLALNGDDEVLVRLAGDREAQAEVIRIVRLHGPTGEHDNGFVEVVRRHRGVRVVTSLTPRRRPEEAAAPPGNPSGRRTWSADVVASDGALAGRLRASSVRVPAPGGPRAFEGIGRVRPRLLPPMGSGVREAMVLASSAAACWPLDARRLRDVLRLCDLPGRSGGERAFNPDAVATVRRRSGSAVRQGIPRPLAWHEVEYREGQNLATGLSPMLMERVLARAIRCWAPLGVQARLRERRPR